MDRIAILNELKKLLAPYTEKKEMLANIHEDTDLVKDLKINSANLVDIIIEAESKYKIEIDFDMASKMYTVGNCIDVISAKFNQPG